LSKTDEYTAYALALLEIAEQTSSPIHKQHLLRMAERWLDLVERLSNRRRRSDRGHPEHPLVKTKLGDEHTDA
jgi:hypothetical protein